MYPKIKHLSALANLPWLIDKFYYAKSLAIDIKPDMLSAVYLDKTITGIKLLDHLILDIGILRQMGEPIPKEKENVFVTEIRRFIKKNGIGKDTEIVVGLPRSLVIVKFVEIPSPDESSIADILSYDIDRHIPSGRENIYYDFEIIEKKEGNTYRILLAAAQRRVVDYYLSLIKKASLNPHIVYVSSLADLNIYKFCSTNGAAPVLLADMNSKGIELHSIQNNAISWSKNLSVQLGSYGNSDRTFNEEAIKRCGDMITAEFNNTASTNIALSRGDAWCRKLKEYLTDEKQINTRILEPVNKLSCEKNIQGNERYLISTAIGLGLRGVSNLFPDINLIPEELRKKKRRGKNFLTTMSLIGIFFITLLASVFGGYVKDKILFFKLDSELKQIKARVAAIEGAGIKSEKIEKQIEEFSKIQEGTSGKLKIIKEFAELIPSTIWISHLKIYKENIEITGYANAASDLIEILEQSDLFKDVHFAGTIKKKKGKEKFKINAVLE